MTVFGLKTVIFDWNPATCYPPGRYVPSTFTADELNFCVRNGNRWILVAIITGMAPLVGLEATAKSQKCLILAYFCPILLHFQRKIKSCAKRVPKHTTSGSDLKNIRRRKFFYGYFLRSLITLTTKRKKYYSQLSDCLRFWIASIASDKAILSPWIST